MEQLLVAAVKGDVAEVAELLDSGLDPNWVDSVAGNSALYNATYTDQPAVVKLLLNRGANPNLRLNYRSSVDGRQECNVVALMFAMSEEVAKTLIEAGADVNAEDDFGVTPLIRATYRGKADIVALLLHSGANPKHRTKNGKTARDIVQWRIEDLKSCDVGVNSAIITERIATCERILPLLPKE